MFFWLSVICEGIIYYPNLLYIYIWYQDHVLFFMYIQYGKFFRSVIHRYDLVKGKRTFKSRLLRGYNQFCYFISCSSSFRPTLIEDQNTIFVWRSTLITYIFFIIKMVLINNNTSIILLLFKSFFTSFYTIYFTTFLYLFTTFLKKIIQTFLNMFNSF